MQQENTINSMSKIHKSLIALLEQVEKGSIQLRQIKKIALDQVKKLDHLFEGYIVIVDLTTNTPVYFNVNALNYLGVRPSYVNKLKSLDFFRKVLHPSNFDLIISGLVFFKENSKSTFNSVARVKKFDGSWRYVFFSVKPVEYNFAGEATLALVFALDIDEVLTNRSTLKDLKSSFQKSNNITLSKREKEILIGIAKEQTTKEIAEVLFLSKHTIDTYRKRLIRKLNVKSSIGLAIYAYQIGLMSD